MTDVIDPIIIFLIVLLVSVTFVTIAFVSVLLDRRRKRLRTQLAASGNQTTNDAELGLIYDKLWHPWRNRRNRDEVINLDSPARCSQPVMAAHKRLSQAGTLRSSSPGPGFDKDVGSGAGYHYRPESPYQSKEAAVSGDAAGYYGGTSPSPRWGGETFGKGGKYEMESSVERQRQRQRQNTLWPGEDGHDKKEGEDERRSQFQWADVAL